MRRPTRSTFILAVVLFVFSSNGALCNPSGSALLFQVDDFVDLGTTPLLNPFGPFTIEAWVRHQQKLNGGAIFGRHNAGHTDGYILHVATSSYLYEFMIIGSRVRSMDTVELDEWTHVAAVYGNGYMKIYRNGVRQASLMSSPPPRSALKALIGNVLLDNRPTGGAEAIIDEVRFWNTARTEDEINEFKDVSLTGSEAGLVGLWNFEEGSGQIAHDSGPNGLDGVLGYSTEDSDGDPEWVPFDYVFPAETDTPTASPSPTATETGTDTPTPSPSATETEAPTNTFVPTTTPTVPSSETPTFVTTPSTGISRRHWDFY